MGDVIFAVHEPQQSTADGADRLYVGEVSAMGKHQTSARTISDRP
jgi:hypothetical protein